MTTCCPNCSATSLGAEAASICSECATATVAGASFSVPMMLGAMLAASVAVIAWRTVRRVSRPVVTVSPTLA